MANWYNAERYADPTAYHALTNIEREQRRARNAKERSDRKKARRKANSAARKAAQQNPAQTNNEKGEIDNEADTLHS